MTTPGNAPFGSPFPTHPSAITQASPATLLGGATPGLGSSTRAIPDADAQAEFMRDCADMLSLCYSVSAQANAAFDAVEGAFSQDGPAGPECIITFLSALESLKMRLVATGLGGLNALEPSSLAKSGDTEPTSLAEARAKEAAAFFASSQRLQEGAKAVADILQQPARLT